MHTMSGRPSPFRSATAQAAAPMPSLVQNVLRPPRAGGILGVIDVHAVALAAISGDHFVAAVAIQVGGLDGVAVHQRTIDHHTLPGSATAAVDSHLVAVPGLYGRQVPLLAQLPDG